MSVKNYLAALFLILNWNLSSQIVTKENVSNSKKNLKDTNSRFYVETSILSSFRTLESNPNFLNTPLGERANEVKFSIWNYALGMTTPLTNYLFFDGGLSILRNGEHYSWESTTSDSTYNYQTKYNYLGLPLQLKLQGGKNLKYFVGAGIIPQMHLSYKQKQQWTDSLGSKRTGEEKVNNQINSFALSWIVSAGIEFQFENDFGLRLSGTYRNQISNTYTEFNDYIHKANALGFNVALTRKF
jgi:hypothetical protein